MNGIDELLTRYRRRGVLVDTGPLLLFFVGSYDPQQVAAFKRTQKYDAEAFEIVIGVLNWFEVVVVTPHILTEVSNFSRELPDHPHAAYFANVAAHLVNFKERFLDALRLSTSPYFARFGVTDTAIIETPPGKHLVFTDDFALFNTLQSRGVDALNLNHLRAVRWGIG